MPAYDTETPRFMLNDHTPSDLPRDLPLLLMTCLGVTVFRDCHTWKWLYHDTINGLFQELAAA